jgi:spermidine/putrescine transport system permease protein
LKTEADIGERLLRADIRRRWLLTGPALLITLLAATGPLVIVLVYSFLSPGPYGDVEWRFSTEAWFSVMFERDIFDGTVTLARGNLDVVLRSLRLAALTTLITLFLGFPTAWFIATRPQRTREVWLFLVTIPFWINLLIRTIAILEVVRNQGLINTVLLKLRLIDAPIQILFTDGAILAGLAYAFLPFMVLPIYASLEKFDFRLAEAASDLYAKPSQVLRRVVLPLSRPGIIAGSILVFIPSLSAYVTPVILGGGKNLMLGNMIELQFGQGRNWPLGAAFSIALMTVVMLALLAYVRVSGDRRGDGQAL